LQLVINLQPFRRNSVLECVSQSKIANKNSLKPLILGVHKKPQKARH